MVNESIPLSYSELQKRLHALEEELSFYHDMMNYIPGHIYWLDQNNRYLGCNEENAKNIGLHSRLDIVGKTNADLPWKAVAETIDQTNDEVMRSGEPATLKETGLVNGVQSTFLSQKVPLKNKHNKTIGILGISINITEIEQLQKSLIEAKEAAEAASRAKTEFIANISHDVRTPLTGIIGFSRFLEEEIKDAEEKEYAHLIHQSGEQLLGLLNGVLDLISADSTNDDQVLHQSFDVRRVIQDVIELEKPTVKTRHLDIKSEIADDVPQYVIGDRMKLHRIILNLTGNAIKFTQKGYVGLNARLLELKDGLAMIEFSVKDTGIGIPEELQDKVFDRFFKVSPSYKGLYTGNGIGLHIAQKYVELMRGEIRLTSQVNVGSTFSFVLPMKVGEKPLEEVQPSSNKQLGKEAVLPAKEAIPLAVPVSINADQLPVLLVEDNALAMKSLQLMLKPFPVQIYSVCDAESAFELVENQNFALIITDLGLPKMQGDELVHEIRALEKVKQRTPATIVGLTGHARGEVIENCLQAGMDEVYSKPMKPAPLTTLIDKLIQIKEKSAESFSASESTRGRLGPDLPNTEAELFQLGQFPLIDVEVGIATLGSEETMREILATLKTDAVDEDLELIQQAHAVNDWNTVQQLAHKIKGGATFGTVRMYYALLYLERYRKAGHTARAEELYMQMLGVIEQSMVALQQWLKN